MVTGASSGIGEAFARTLAAQGWDLTVVARRGDRLEALVAELTRPGTDHDAVVADLTDPSELERVAGLLTDPTRPYDLLVNNAGVGTQGRFWTLPVEGELAEISLNVVAPVRLSHAAVGPMVARGRGSIVNVSSIAGLQPLPLWSTYSSTKSYLSNFSRSLNAELAGTGVRVLDVKPGFTRTEFQKRTPFSLQVVPGPMWLSSETVVRASLESLERGTELCLPGWQSRLLATASFLSPWPLTKACLALATRRLRDQPRPS